MKRFILLLTLISSLIFFAVTAAIATPGVFSDVPVTEQTVIDAAEFAVKTKAKEISDGNTSAAVSLELLEIISAQQQVVSGINYRLRVTVSLAGRKKMAEAVVWWQAWREPDPYVLTSWSWIEPSKGQN